MKESALAALFFHWKLNVSHATAHFIISNSKMRRDCKCFWLCVRLHSLASSASNALKLYLGVCVSAYAKIYARVCAGYSIFLRSLPHAASHFDTTVLIECNFFFSWFMSYTKSTLQILLSAYKNETNFLIHSNTLLTRINIIGFFARAFFVHSFVHLFAFPLSSSCCLAAFPLFEHIAAAAVVAVAVVVN